jgi:hypothetical protein
MAVALISSDPPQTPEWHRSDLCRLISDLWRAAACASLLPNAQEATYPEIGSGLRSLNCDLRHGLVAQLVRARA